MIKPSKEAVLAVSLGVILGIVVAYGAWRANRALKQSGVVSPEANTTNLAADTLDVSEPIRDLEIYEPVDGVLYSESQITIVGKAPIGAYVVVMDEEQESISQTNELGEFSSVIDLIKGVNKVKVAAIESSGQVQIEDVTIVYSEAEI